MAFFDSIDEFFIGIRNLNQCSKALLTFATVLGLLSITIFFIKLIHSTIQGFRLYVLSQYIWRTNLVKKYGKWACISGATDGIGLAMAEELARRGHSIIVIGRNEAKLAKVKANLEKIIKNESTSNDGEIITVKIDLSDSSVENYDKIKNQIAFDKRDIGILINNAGVFSFGEVKRFGNFELEDIRNMVNINILATLYLTKMALPGMCKRRKGLIINVSSIVGNILSPYVNVYGATKTFINRFSAQLQLEYRSHPIDIINLTPGAVHTKLLRTASWDKIVKPTIWNPSTEHYARSSLNAISTRIKSISGTVIHGSMVKVVEVFHLTNYIPLIIDLVVNRSHKDLSSSKAKKSNCSSYQSCKDDDRMNFK